MSLAVGVLIPFSLVILVLTSLVDAALPWHSRISDPALKTGNEVSFDPLSLLAILWNPRASASAARLYMQPDRKIFRWPHMMQIGAVLIPVSMLVNHLTRNYKSAHPGLYMCTENIDNLDVKSTIGVVKPMPNQPMSDSLFSRLPVCTSDSHLISALNFKPSKFPTNDMVVVYVNEAVSVKDASDTRTSSSSKSWVAHTLVICTELVMGLIVLCGTIFGALLGDLWAVVLFATYTFHWFASTAISFRQLVIPDPGLQIQHDQTIVFAVYQRDAGGLIIFKGSQYIMEKWARTKWVFNEDNAYHTFIHWVWMLTGTAAAFASVACMVNMSGYLQLGFLGMLFYSSIAELWLTFLASELQTATFHGSLSTKAVEKNQKRYKSIIQASLGLDKEHRLDMLKWIDLELLSPKTVFQAMAETLDYLNHHDTQDNINMTNEILAQSKLKFDEACKTLPSEDSDTRDGIWLAIQEVWMRRKTQKPDSIQSNQVSYTKTCFC